MIEGVLSLRLAGWFGQAQIGWLYTGMALLLAASAVVAGRVAPRGALATAVVLLPAGVAVAGAAGTVPLFLAGLAVAAVGVGVGETGSTGVLLESVAPERIVTAMVLWSAIGIAGYLAGPVIGGAVAQAFGYPALGLVPLAVAAVLLAAFSRASRPAR
ncbi:MAG TPA: MFS transporter [Actinomycetota bacterium]|jgi:MFS family permease|nr:MFS transporter [Actinomycetota bacterium]